MLLKKPEKIYTEFEENTSQHLESILATNAKKKHFSKKKKKSGANSLQKQETIYYRIRREFSAEYKKETFGKESNIIKNRLFTKLAKECP